MAAGPIGPRTIGACCQSLGAAQARFGKGKRGFQADPALVFGNGRGFAQAQGGAFAQTNWLTFRIAGTVQPFDPVQELAYGTISPRVFPANAGIHTPCHLFSALG